MELLAVAIIKSRSTYENRLRLRLGSCDTIIHRGVGVRC